MLLSSSSVSPPDSSWAATSAEDVVAGVAAQGLEVLEHPRVQRVHGELAAAELAVPYPEVDQRDGVGAPPQELLAHGLGRSQYLGDDGERQQGGVVADQVHVRAAAGHRVEELLGDLLGACAECGDGAG